MARMTYVLRDGELVPKHLAPPLHASLDAPMIRTDGMDPIQSMLDGQTYDSRSGYYASLRRAGAEIVGNDRAPFERDRAREFNPQGVGESIKQAIEQIEGGYRGR